MPPGAPSIVHALPGRVRIAVPAMRRRPEAAAAVVERLAALDGVRRVDASARTGRALILYDPRRTDPAAVIGAAAAAAVAASPARPTSPAASAVPGLDVVAPAVLLAAVGAKRLALGPSATSRAPWVDAAAGAVGILSATPALQRGLRRTERGVGADALLAGTSLALLLARESVLGLALLSLLNLTRWLERNALERAEQAIAAGPAGSAARDASARAATRIEGSKPAHRSSSPWVLPAFTLAATGQPLRALTVWVAALPTARDLAAPMANRYATLAATRLGVYPRRPTVIARAGRVDAVVLELPALLEPEPRVEEVLSLHVEYPPDRVAALAARAVQSRHPALAAALKRPALHSAGGGARSESVETPAGRVASVRVEGHRAMVGSLPALAATGISTDRGGLDALRFDAAGDEILGVAHAGALVGLVAVRRTPRPEARALVDSLRALGILDLRVLDTEPLPLHAAAARRLGLGTAAPGVVGELRRDGRSVLVLAATPAAAPALAAADVAMVPAGSPLAAQAHVVYEGQGIGRAALLVGLGRQAAEVSRQGEILAATFSVCGLGMTMAGAAGLAQALFTQDVASLCVIANARRLLRLGGRAPAIRWGDGAASPSGAPSRWSRAIPKPPRPVAGGSGFAAAEPVAAWYRLPVGDVERRLDTSGSGGLTSAAARARLARCGRNVLPSERPSSPIKLFGAQFKDLTVLTLLGASGISLATGALKDALTILGMLLLNGVFTVAQEYHTGRSVRALRRLATSVARVRRGGRLDVIPAEELVPGDVIELEPGTRVPADARLVEVRGLETEESSLTGESLPVAKRVVALSRDGLAPGDRLNMVFMGTDVVRGRGRAIVIGTGMDTEMGRIVALLQEAGDERTPLQRDMDVLGRALLGVSVGAAGLLAAVGLLRRRPFVPTLLSAIGLAVAAIPDGLPTMITIALAAGVGRMVRKRVIVRRMSALETLASTSVICSDKTGTLTQNEMRVRAVYTVGGGWQVAAAAGGEARLVAEEPFAAAVGEDGEEAAGAADILHVLAAGAACHDGMAVVGERVGAVGEGEALDPIDSALNRAAMLLAGPTADPSSAQFLEGCERLAETPFDAERRRLTVLVRGGDGRSYLVTKGASDVILPLCTRCRQQGGDRPLDERDLERMALAMRRMATGSLRVVAVAYREVDGALDPARMTELERNLTFLGLVGMVDPPRSEAASAVESLRRTGVRLLMVTGDHPDTAAAISREIGLLGPGGRVLTGADIDAMDQEELGRVLPEVQICARVTPRHKLRIVRALRQAGRSVAMMGDGVNDAPALKEATVGIALGTRAADATKQAASLILTDNDLSAVVQAITEGRGLRANIRRALGYLLAGNLGEVLVMLAAGVAGAELPLNPTQLLVVNFLSDGLPALMLATGRPSAGALGGSPAGADDRLLSRGLGRQIATRGTLMGLGSLALYGWGLRGGSLIRARSLALASIVLNQWVQVPDWQFEGRPIPAGERRDPWLLASVGASALMLPLLFHVPALQALVETAPLAAGDWLAVAGSSLALGAVSRHLSAGLRATGTGKAGPARSRRGPADRGAAGPAGVLPSRPLRQPRPR